MIQSTGLLKKKTLDNICIYGKVLKRDVGVGAMVLFTYNTVIMCELCLQII